MSQDNLSHGPITWTSPGSVSNWPVYADLSELIGRLEGFGQGIVSMQADQMDEHLLRSWVEETRTQLEEIREKLRTPENPYITKDTPISPGDGSVWPPETEQDPNSSAGPPGPPPPTTGDPLPAPPGRVQ